MEEEELATSSSGAAASGAHSEVPAADRCVHHSGIQRVTTLWSRVCRNFIFT